jgi:hypothetical protein
VKSVEDETVNGGYGRGIHATRSAYDARPERVAVKLGNATRAFMEQKVEPGYKKFSSLMDAWGALLPLELAEHCTVADLSGGRLRVLTDTPSYMYELRLHSRYLLGQLQKRCPGLRLQRIEVAVGQL